MYVDSTRKICENILIIFALFVRVKSLTLSELRNKQPLKAAEMVNIVKEAYAVEDFQREITSHYMSDKINLENGNLNIVLDKLKSHIDNVQDIFTDAAYNYIVRKLRIYCKIAIEILKRRKNTIITANEIMHLALFQESNYYHVITFLYNYVDDINGILEVILFLQMWPYMTIHQISEDDINRFTNEAVQNKLSEFVNGLQLLGGSELGDENFEVIDSRKALLRLLDYVRHDISIFSQHFCIEPLKPIVDKHLYVPINDEEYVPDIYKYSVEHETCAITFEYLDSMMITQNFRITTWNCNQILTLPEYKFNDNERADSVSLSCLCWSLVQCREIYYTTSWLMKFGKRKLSTEKRESINNELASNDHTIVVSILELQDIIASESHYLNVVQYSNIVANILILVSIKEGTKPMKGIKSKMKIACANKKNPSLTFEDIRTMRNSLLMVKQYFEDFIKHVESQLPILFLYEKEKSSIQQFRDNTNMILKYLKVDQTLYKYLNTNCKLIATQLKELVDALPSDNQLKFDHYYFFHPPINVNEINKYYQTFMK